MADGDTGEVGRGGSVVVSEGGGGRRRESQISRSDRRLSDLGSAIMTFNRKLLRRTVLFVVRDLVSWLDLRGF